MLNPIAFHPLQILQANPTQNSSPVRNTGFQALVQNASGGASTVNNSQIMQVNPAQNASGPANLQIMQVGPSGTSLPSSTPRLGSGSTTPGNLQIMQVGPDGTSLPSSTPRHGSGSTTPGNLQIMQVGPGGGRSVPVSNLQIMKQNGSQGSTVPGNPQIMQVGPGGRSVPASNLQIMKQNSPNISTISAHALEIMMMNGSKGKTFPSPNGLQIMHQSPASTGSNTDLSA